MEFEFIQFKEIYVIQASKTLLQRRLHLPRILRSMHREIDYFPRDFIYLFHTSMTFFSFSSYGSLRQKITDNLKRYSIPSFFKNALICTPRHRMQIQN